MTEPDGDPPDARWCAGVAASLAGASERVSRLALVIADDWRDARGQEWAERTTLLHRELGRVAAQATEIGTAIAQQAAEVVAPPDPGADPPTPLPAAVPGATAAHARGPRLGAVAGDRTQDGLGMRIAELPEPG